MVRLKHLDASRVFLILSICLYVASLPCNCFYVDGKGNWAGCGLVVLGFLTFLDNSTNMIWCANPLVFLAWLLIFLRARWAAISIGAIALLTGIAFLSCTKILVSESGTLSKLTGLDIGYWLWLASLACAFSGAISIPPPAKS
jgi:hypothetical protein